MVWNGTEEMIGKSFKRLVHLPKASSSRPTIASSETVKSLVVTVQGAQVLHIIIRALRPGAKRNSQVLNSLALDKMFYFLAIMGRLRVVCAFSLTSDLCILHTLQYQRKTYPKSAKCMQELVASGRPRPGG